MSVVPVSPAAVEAAAEVIHREVTWATGDDSRRIATAALSAAMPAITEHLREKVQTAFDDDNEQADGFDSDDYNDG